MKDAAGNLIQSLTEPLWVRPEKSYSNFTDYRDDSVQLTSGGNIEILDLSQINFVNPGRVSIQINGTTLVTYDTSSSETDYNNSTWADIGSQVASQMAGDIHAWTDGVYAEHGGFRTGANSTDYFDLGDGKRHQPLIYLEGENCVQLETKLKFEDFTTNVISSFESIEADDYIARTDLAWEYEVIANNIQWQTGTLINSDGSETLAHIFCTDADGWLFGDKDPKFYRSRCNACDVYG